LPTGHPDFSRFQTLTRAEEAAGLLDDGPKIGFRVNWERILAEKGYGFRGHRLVPVETGGGAAPPPIESPIRIHRHKTAITRTEPSKPVKLLLEHNGLRPGDSFFDYGCGHGTDVAALSQLGWDAAGWDPVHAPEGGTRAAEVVNLGFVLNVIEDPAERVETLLAAWGCCRRLLVVATLVQGQESYGEVQLHQDGVLTRRGTFQKHFEQSELQSLLEHTLHQDAVPVALGIFFVFRETADQQDFLAERSRRFIDWESLSRRLGLYRALRTKTDPYLTHRELLDTFWETMLALGRLPRRGEFEPLAEVRKACGSIPKALTLFREKFGEETLAAARARRQEDVLVYVAAGLLRKRIPFRQLSAKLQQDIRSFFGDFGAAEEKARDLLFSAGDKDELMLAIEPLDFGWWDPEEEHFTIHRSLLDELPAILRVFVECGARLFGNPREADLIKIHVGSRKLGDSDFSPFQTPGLGVI
jgi:DNA phosphorothioation-associated putative methyltransferase